MKKLLTVLFLIISTQSFTATDNNKRLKLVLKNLVPKLTEKQLKNFKYEECKIQKEKWAMLLVTKVPFEENIAFNDKCFLKGSFTAKMDEFFPISLDLKNLPPVATITGEMRISIIFTDKTVLKVEFGKGSYFNEKKILMKRFQFTYSFEIDPLNPDKMIKEDLGGKLDIIEKGKIAKSIKL